MDDKLFQSLEWRLIGPHRAGRVVTVAGDPNEWGTFYFGGCAGGVWKTTSGGAYWENVTDGFLKTSAIGALDVSRSEPNVIYAGTGEACLRSNISHGDGVYKSTDAGHSWFNVGLADTRHIGRLAIDPTNSDIVFVAALGHAWGKNEERGIFRTRDGGKSWEKVLYKSDGAGAIDVSIDPSNPRVVYAAIWQVQRYPHTLDSGGPESGIWRSLDGGDTWEDITRNSGLPTGVLGKIGVAASGAKPGRVWALIESDDGALFRSEDYGQTWARINEEGDLRRRPWYYMHVYADPQDENELWILNLNCWKSTDGGKTFESIPTPHGDNHGLWIDPHNSKRLIESNDGGAIVSYDGGRTWSSILNQPTAQFYHVAADNQFPYHVYGSQQDNYAMRLPTIGNEGAITWANYVEPGGGESGHIAISPKEPHRVFGGGIGTGPGHGRILAWNPISGHKRNVTVWPEVNGFGSGAIDLKYRFQWTFPIEFSPHDPNILHITSNYVHRSTDEGSTWTTISPDLTRNDPSTLQSSGGVITDDNSGAEIYGTIFAFAESRLERGVFWAGSDDGLVHISRDDGKTWTNITPTGLPEWTMISIIDPSPHDAATAYMAATGYKQDDLAPYLFKTNDYGQTWTLITSGFPADEFTRVIREDPNRRGLLYAGTETGIYVSLDDGAHWQRAQGNLPIVPVYDVIIKDKDLVAATHGRAFWVLDDVSPLHQMQDEIAGKAAHLFKPRDTVRVRTYGRAYGANPDRINYMMAGPVTVAYKQETTPMGTRDSNFLDAGKNPPDGVIIHYYLKEKPEGDVTLRILDSDGEEINSFTSSGNRVPRVPTAAGANRFVWDYRQKSVTPLDDPAEPDTDAQLAEATLGPRVNAGTYRVELTVGGETQTETFKILRDPRHPATDEELAEQARLKLGIRDEISRINMMVNQIRRIEKQLDGWSERIKASGENASLGEDAEAAKKKLDELLNELIQTKPGRQAKGGASRLKDKLNTLSTMIDESDDAPTEGAREVYDSLGERVDERSNRLHRIVAGDLAAFNAKVQEAGLAPVGD
ncbi:MAG TPA: glycosyl hydrolase [Nitrolancea sp.]|nr:glycosyl hydrolase [Nitrolancea sp.]